MTKKKRRQVLPAQRKRITLALMEPGCDVDELAKKYKLARSTLLKYRCQYKKEQSENLLVSNKTHFVEVKTEASNLVSGLKKVELLFDNHKCSIEGRFSSNQLLKLIELLEETC